MRFSLLPVFLFVLIGCEAPAPVPVDDPRAYLHRTLVETATPSWASGRTDYNLDDAALLDSVIVRTLDTMSGSEGALPGDERALDRLARRAEGHYTGAFTATAEARAATEARIRARFADPPTAQADSIATADLGLAPVRFVPHRSVSWRAGRAPESEGGELRPDVLVAAFGHLARAHPGALTYELTTIVPYGSSVRRLRYAYFRSTDRLHVWVRDDAQYASRGGRARRADLRAGPHPDRRPGVHLLPRR